MRIKLFVTLSLLPFLVHASTRILGEITPPIPNVWRVEWDDGGTYGLETLEVFTSQESVQLLWIMAVPVNQKLAVSNNGCFALAASPSGALYDTGPCTVFRMSEIDSIYFILNSGLMKEQLKHYINLFIKTGKLLRDSPQIYKIAINKRQETTKVTSEADNQAEHSQPEEKDHEKDLPEDTDEHRVERKREPPPEGTDEHRTKRKRQ